MIFYSDAPKFKEVHPFPFADECSPLKKYLWFNFSSAETQLSASGPIPVSKQKFTPEKGYGWVKSYDLKIITTSLKSQVYTSFATSGRPATFRMKCPLGYYYLTMTFGNCNQSCGPFNVKVNDEIKLKEIKLDKGRFSTELILVKADKGIIDVKLEGVNGNNWILNGMALQPVMTMNEDFIFTRPWWHYENLNMLNKKLY
ncbi:MAG: hypothetical protein Q7J67_00480 [bacterium]|nr:hypothetical protein [bacterium]